jgi:hypothetical protein
MNVPRSAVLRAAAAAVMLALGGAASSATMASSSFDTGSEGWLAVNGSTPIAWVPSGGTDGAYVRASDSRTGALWFFSAPSAYLGDQSAAFGAELSFSLRSEQPSAPLNTPYAQVQLLGTNGILLAWHGGSDPGPDWTSYTVSLDTASGWTVGSLGGAPATEADLRSVLGSLQVLRIRGDYGQAVDSTGLDSVSLASAVPEAPVSVMLLLGLAGIGATRRWRTAPR